MYTTISVVIVPFLIDLFNTWAVVYTVEVGTQKIIVSLGQLLSRRPRRLA